MPKNSPQNLSRAGRGSEPLRGAATTGGLRGAPWRFSARQLLLALTATLAIVSVLYLLQPITDPDFFWHLKTGEWIREHRSLPASDPFSYTGEGIATPAARFVLTSYWATQLLFHLFFALGGFTGIVLLRFIIAAALFAAVWKRREGDAVVNAALLLVFAVVFLESYAIERPQVLSFVCFTALLAMLDELRGGAEDRPRPPSFTHGYRGPLLMGSLMLVWANVHGGVVLGQATIAVYLAAEGAKFAHRSLRPGTGAAYRALLISCGAGLALSFANPNTFHALALEGLFSGGPAFGHGGALITEYASTVEAFQRNGNDTVIILWVLMLLAAVAIAAKPGRIDITEALMVAGSGYYAFRHIRYGALFMIVALPVVGRFLSQGARVRPARAALIAGAFAAVFMFARDEPQRLLRQPLGDWVSRDNFPVEAADFIRAVGLTGNMYNFYDWGGYLIWRLAPERKVFIDGRNINPGMHWQSSVIAMGFELAAENNWKALLDRHGVGYVVIPVVYRGKRLPLTDRLIGDPGWAAVFKQGNSVIFARKMPGPR